jgi:hypothetical protein
MTPIADMVELMLAANADASLIVLAVRAVETVALRERDASRHAVTLPSRSPAAIRAARHREKIKQINISAEANDAAEISVSERDASRDGVTQRCDLTSLLPSLKGTSEKGSKGTENARARGTRLAPGTPLSDADRASAIELGASADRVEAMWAEFVDYWIGIPGQRGTKLGDRGWAATWRNRVRAITMFKQLSTIPAGNMGPRKTASERHLTNSKPSTDAAKAVERLLSFYPPLDVSDPKVFIAGIVAILAEYPAQFYPVVVSPTGIPKRIKYLRNLAEIDEVCQELYAPILRSLEREKIAAQPKLLPRRRTAEEQARVDAQVEAWRSGKCTGP